MHDSPSTTSCITGGPAWTVTRCGSYEARRHFFTVLILAILTAAAVCGIAIWHYLTSWLTLPLL
ncbi:MAG: hypothetical protein ABSH32_14335 [Bryobacteraceae bacterium]|jgi:hypothetical protein